MFFCEFCKIFQNTLSTEHFWTTASGINLVEEYFNQGLVLVDE